MLFFPVPKNAYCRVSDDGKYTICRIGSAAGISYELYYGPTLLRMTGPFHERDVPARDAAYADLVAAAERHSQQTAQAA